MPTDVRRVVEAHCVSCHGAEKPKASLDLTRYKTADDLRAGHEIWKEAIRYKINDGKGRVVRDVIA
jgi:mono/diheme cytochrome c family protein